MACCKTSGISAKLDGACDGSDCLYRRFTEIGKAAGAADVL